MTIAVIAKRKVEPAVLGPDANGTLMTPREFDRADYDEEWRFELINGVVIVSPIPLEGEVDPNEELGYWLRSYQEHHPQGSSLDATLPERIVRTGPNRRRVDRCIWAGLGRLPKKSECPTVAVEFVSSRKRDRQRDYETKRDEYLAIKIKEYWIIDCFERCMVVFTRQAGRTRRQVVLEHQTYTTPLLPGFELALAKLLALANRWK